MDNKCELVHGIFFELLAMKETPKSVRLFEAPSLVAERSAGSEVKGSLGSFVFV